MRRGLALILPLSLVLMWLPRAVAQSGPGGAAVAAFSVTGDGIATPLAGLKGDADKGRTVALDPERGNCTICHPVPGGDARLQGTVGPPLAGVARRLSVPQLRLRVVDGTRINPATIMPPYHRVDGLNKVGAAWRGKPVLSAQDVEDVVAFLATLSEELR